MKTKDGEPALPSIACICTSVGREVSYLSTNDECLAHGEKYNSYDSVKDMPLIVRLAWRRHRQAVYLATIFSQLKNCARVDQITQIPDILIPRKTLTVSKVREAAARLQCELVLIYRIDHNVRYKYKWLGRDTSKVYSSVNGMLLHTRTGIVPFTTVVDQEHKTVEKKSGETTQELHQRTRHEVTLVALQKLGTELAAFLNSIK